MKCLFIALLLATLVDIFFHGSCKHGEARGVIFFYHYIMRKFHVSLEWKIKIICNIISSVNNIYFQCKCVQKEWHVAKKAKPIKSSISRGFTQSCPSAPKKAKSRVCEVLVVHMFPKCHHTAQHPELRSLPVSWGAGQKSRGLFSQNVQGINYDPPKKVGTVLKQYFYSVHHGGLLYGKAVGVELRTTQAWFLWHHVKDNIVWSSMWTIKNTPHQHSAALLDLLALINKFMDINGFKRNDVRRTWKYIIVVMWVCDSVNKSLF